MTVATHSPGPAPAPAAHTTSQQHQNLREDLAHVVELHRRILAQTTSVVDPTRVLAAMSAAKGAERYLPYTIPSLIQQIARAGRRADIVLGLNNGYTCPEVLAYFSTLPDTDLVHLYTGDKPGGDIPSPLLATPDASTVGYRIPQEHPRHRIFALHQKSGPHAAGKSRMLGDICHSLLLENIEHGWIPPAYLLMSDSESMIREDNETVTLQADIERLSRLLRQTSSLQQAIELLVRAHFAAARPRIPVPELVSPGIDLAAPGLELLIADLDRDDSDIVSVGWRNCVYDIETTYNGMPVLLPNLAVETSMLNEIVYALAGIVAQMMVHFGGCTIGRTPIMLALHATMYRTYPGVVGEDALSSVLAYHAGFKTTIHRGVYVTNRTPTLDEVVGSPPIHTWKEQYARWIAGNTAIERLYGAENIIPITGSGATLNDAVALAFFLRKLRQTNNLTQSLQVLYQMEATREDLNDIRKIAEKKNYVYCGNYTSAAW